MIVLDNEPFALKDKVAKFSFWLYNTPLYASQQGGHTLRTYLLVDAATGTCVYALMHLFGQESMAISPKRAPFGSVEVSEGISYETLQEWLQLIALDCQRQGFTHLHIRHFPEGYAPQRAVFVKRGLLRSGFTISQSFENQHIVVNHLSFEAHIHASERRRLRKCVEANFTFEQWTHPEAAQVYDYIRTNRQQLGYALTFSEDDLRRWLALFPERYLVFCVKDGEHIASLTLTVWVGAQVLYNFCPANAPAYKSFSPAVLLTAGLYAFCQQQRISVLDLGISVDEAGLPKAGLLRFKRNLGAVSSAKMTFQRAL